MFPLFHGILSHVPEAEPPPSGWWDDDGNISGALAAWQAKGAASYAASLLDLTGNGHDLLQTNGAVPWDASDGWQLVAANSQALLMPFVPQSQNYSYLVQYANASTDSTPLIGFVVNITPRQFGTDVRYKNGSIITIAPVLNSGNLGIAGTRGYRNGTAEGAAMTGNPPAAALTIGANWNGSSASDFITANVYAVAVYNVVLSAEDMATIAANMAAL